MYRDEEFEADHGKEQEEEEEEEEEAYGMGAMSFSSLSSPGDRGYGREVWSFWPPGAAEAGASTRSLPDRFSVKKQRRGNGRRR